MHDLDRNGKRDLVGQHTTAQTEFEDYNGKTITLQRETMWDAAAGAGYEVDDFYCIVSLTLDGTNKVRFRVDLMASSASQPSL